MNDTKHEAQGLESQQSAPAGYVLVPVEPTPEMLDVAVSHALMVSISGEYNWSAYMRDVWKRMLAAAPVQPAQAQGWQMVLPERSSLDMKKGDIIYRAALVWNACLDEVARLNAAAPQPSDDAKDAARYRFLKSKCDTGFITNLEDNVFVSRWDAAIDAAMAGVGWGMSEVIKYEEGDPCAGMYESSEGVWVHIDDYDQLKAKLAACLCASKFAAEIADELKAECDTLRKQLDEARELLMDYGYSTGDLDGRVDAWLERNKG